MKKTIAYFLSVGIVCSAMVACTTKNEENTKNTNPLEKKVDDDDPSLPFDQR